MSRKTKYDFYGDHFKATAVELGGLPSVKATDVAKILDIHPVMLYRWKKEYRDGDIMVMQDKGTLETEEKSELKRLRKMEKAHQELLIKHDLLKKKHPILFGSKKEIFQFIETQRAQYKLRLLFEVYDVTRFGYASWKARGQSKHTKRDRELKVSIEKIFGSVDGIYGSPKIHELLKQAGEVVGKKRVARLMQENNLKVRCSRIYKNNTKQDRFYASISNKIHELEATGPNQIWVGDVTYLWVNEQWRYLATIMDKY